MSERLENTKLNLGSDIGRAAYDLEKAEIAIKISAERVARSQETGMEEFLQRDPQAKEKIKTLIEKTQLYHQLQDKARDALKEAAVAGQEVARLTGELYGPLEN